MKLGIPSGPVDRGPWLERAVSASDHSLRRSARNLTSESFVRDDKTPREHVFSRCVRKLRALEFFVKR